MSKWKWYVYVIECQDKTHYTGLTWDVANRVWQHFLFKGSKYTARHKPAKVVYVEEHDDLEVARKRERQIKDWSQAKKKKLISGEWQKDW